jgi:Tfp pilus assembly protein PilF
VEAYQQYLKGYYFWNKRTKESFAKAIECFHEAVRLDPSYALAYVGLADAYGFSSSGERSYLMLQKALQLDDTLGEAHASLACHRLFNDWNRSEAEREFNRALELNPNYATARHWHAYYFAVTGNLDEALAEIRRAQQLDPLSLIINTDVGQILFLRAAMTRL